MAQLIILATPAPLSSHMAASSGALRPLLARGHRVIFLLSEQFYGTQAKYGFEEILYPRAATLKNDSNSENVTKFCSKIDSPTEKMKQLISEVHSEASYEAIRLLNDALEGALAKVKPHLIYHDSLFLYPAIYSSGLPWIRQLSLGPLLSLFNDAVPPAFSGLPSKGARRSDVQSFNRLRHQLLTSPSFNDFLQGLGYERYPFESICPESQALTVYAYPTELNYPYVQKLSWFNLELFSQWTEPDQPQSDQLSELIPESFLSNQLDGSFSGKLIFISIAHQSLLERLLECLTQSGHKCIVSKGEGNPKEMVSVLERNMCWVPGEHAQKLLPSIDLVITDGGSVTVADVLLHGKPSILCPLLLEHLDAAQRLQETGYGLRLDAGSFTRQQLTTAITQLLDNEQLKIKLRQASRRLKFSRRHEELADKLEDMLR